jgi:prepilin-type N-terminal cleavage/methylation domain-containing protein/prepilin-type processing-associated H-X9-DG protein
MPVENGQLTLLDAGQVVPVRRSGVEGSPIKNRAEPTPLHGCGRRSMVWGRGWTLVELLAVVAVLSLLAAIGLPAVAAARARAKSSMCASNLRGVGQAIEVFSVQDQDRPAPCVWERDTNWERGPQIGWDLLTGRTLNLPGGQGSFWQCPQQRTAFVGNPRALGVDRSHLRYDGKIHRVSRSKWYEPAKLVLAYDLQYDVLDNVYKHANDPGAADLSDEYYPWPMDAPWTLQLWLPGAGPHGEKFGALFADGHCTVALYDERNGVLWSGPRWWPEWWCHSETHGGAIE